MSSDDITSALDNLAAIKAGEDPRSQDESDRPSEEAAATASPSHHQKTHERLESDDALELMKGEIDRLYDEYAELRDNLPRTKLHCGVARWDGRNGYCRYNSRLTGERFNKRVTGMRSKSGHHAVLVNEKILEDGNRDGFLDTVRHEVAHAVVYEIHNESQNHNHHWKAMATKLGADPSSCHNKRDRSEEFEYYIYCPSCGMKGGKTKRSKVIKQPFNRKCGKCGNSPLSSYEAGQEPPEENGVVAVESLSWDNQSEWYEAGMP